jgi:acetyl esterase/lipase
MQWFIVELAWVLLVIESIYTTSKIFQGALAQIYGWFCTAVMALSISILWGLYKRGLETGAHMEKVLSIGLGADYLSGIRPERQIKLRTHVPLKSWINPFKMHKPGVNRIHDIPYGTHPRHVLDIYRKDASFTCDGVDSNDKSTALRPVLLQIHGGGWIISKKEEQALPLMNHMAENGWICVAINYRLSPEGRFPDHIIDVKQALSWIKKNIQNYGGDPNFIIATGGSAGGHLCALLGLTANNPVLQPGFESEDTRVQACVPFYGVYDFLDRHNTRGDGDITKFLSDYVMPGLPDEHPALWELASPLSQVHEHAPPFMIIHGEYDTLSFVEEARHFTKAMRDCSKQAVVYAELEGAQHAFEIFHSPRTEYTINAVQCFLEYNYSQYLNHLSVNSKEPKASASSGLDNK